MNDTERAALENRHRAECEALAHAHNRERDEVRFAFTVIAHIASNHGQHRDEALRLIRALADEKSGANIPF